MGDIRRSQGSRRAEAAAQTGGCSRRRQASRRSWSQLRALAALAILVVLHPVFTAPAAFAGLLPSLSHPCMRPQRRTAPRVSLRVLAASLEDAGAELLPLPVPDAAQLALLAGEEMQLLASGWRPIKNGDESLGRRQSYLKMRKHSAPVSVNTATIMQAMNQVVRDRLGPGAVLNDCVLIADFEAKLPRQELHRDVEREAVNSTTHGLLVPLAHGARLHLVPGSHAPRGALRSRFSHREVVTLDVPVGCALLWDGMLVHAGDGAARGTVPGVPNRPRLHGYAEQEHEQRPYDHKGDRSIMEIA